MIVKLLILLGLAWLLIRGRRYLALKQSKKPDTRNLTGNMVACETCHIHVPLVESIDRNGHFYCCRDHVPDP